VWKFLLNYYPWNTTKNERKELRRKKTDDYLSMKLQWKSKTLVQENNFSNYRDRKNLIGIFFICKIAINYYTEIL
jgi:hypothetical protein